MPIRYPSTGKAGARALRRSDRRWLPCLVLLLLCGCPETRRNLNRDFVARSIDLRLQREAVTNLGGPVDGTAPAEVRLHDSARREDVTGNLVGPVTCVVVDRPHLVAIDGEWLEKRPTARILMPPGHHVLSAINEARFYGLQDWLTIKSERTKLELNMEPGKTYEIYGLSGPASRQPLLLRDGKPNRENVFGPISEAQLGEWASWIWVQDDQGNVIQGSRPPSKREE